MSAQIVAVAFDVNVNVISSRGLGPPINMANQP